MRLGGMPEGVWLFFGRFQPHGAAVVHVASHPVQFERQCGRFGRGEGVFRECGRAGIAAGG
jgi:hypothetical protein